MRNLLYISSHHQQQWCDYRAFQSRRWSETWTKNIYTIHKTPQRISKYAIDGGRVAVMLDDDDMNGLDAPIEKKQIFSGISGLTRRLDKYAQYFLIYLECMCWCECVGYNFFLDLLQTFRSRPALSKWSSTYRRLVYQHNIQVIMHTYKRTLLRPIESEKKSKVDEQWFHYTKPAKGTRRAAIAIAERSRARHSLARITFLARKTAKRIHSIYSYGSKNDRVRLINVWCVCVCVCYFANRNTILRSLLRSQVANSFHKSTWPAQTLGAHLVLS